MYSRRTWGVLVPILDGHSPPPPCRFAHGIRPMYGMIDSSGPNYPLCLTDTQHLLAGRIKLYPYNVHSQ